MVLFKNLNTIIRDATAPDCACRAQACTSPGRVLKTSRPQLLMGGYPYVAAAGRPKAAVGVGGHFFNKLLISRR